MRGGEGVARDVEADDVGAGIAVGDAAAVGDGDGDGEAAPTSAAAANAKAAAVEMNLDRCMTKTNPARFFMNTDRTVRRIRSDAASS